MNITIAQLKTIMPLAGDKAVEFLEPLNDAMHEFSIASSMQQAAFLAQCAHESSQLHCVVENLNYSHDGLRKTFPQYFSDGEAWSYEHYPERIANLVYANKNGNGAVESGDGWRFRGRGLIQVTGRDNYLVCSGALDIDLLWQPDLLEEPIPAARSAGWFWSRNRLNAIADDVVAVTKRVNGGLNGLTERRAFFVRACQVLGA